MENRRSDRISFGRLVGAIRVDIVQNPGLVGLFLMVRFFPVFPGGLGLGWKVSVKFALN